MSKILSCVNLKGGVGKTALAVNFAAYCGSQGLKTLLVDLDPQTNATFCCIEGDEWQEHATKYGTVADLFGMRSHANAEGKVRTAKEVIRKDVFTNVDLLPSHLDLFTIDLDMNSAPARELKLRRALQPILGDYEIIVCDCPPNLTLPTQNALAASSHFVVPISPDYLSGIGIGLLLTRVTRLCDALEHKLDHAGIVVSKVGRPAEHREANINALKAQFGSLVIDQQLTERVVVSEAAAQHQPIFQMKNAEATYEFSIVCQELLERMA